MQYWHTIFIVPIVFALINLIHRNFFRRVISWHDKYIQGLSENATDNEKQLSEKAANWITSNLTEIKRRINRAGVHIPVKSYMEPAGYGYLGKQSSGCY
ncbi:MAG: hypothetical protein U5P41_01910 [Gammaproteobacteria bacterium]|nr:hypothetical protein [Gammaproteobacteria bacterium]